MATAGVPAELRHAIVGHKRGASRSQPHHKNVDLDVRAFLGVSARRHGGNSPANWRKGAESNPRRRRLEGQDVTDRIPVAWH